MICGQQPSWMSTPKPENNHIRGFAMQQFVEYDRSIVLLSHPTRAILLFMFFSRLWTFAILIFKVRMIPKLKNNHLSLFAMLKLTEKDPSFVLLAHQALLQAPNSSRVSRHFQKRHRSSFSSKMFQVVNSIIKK